MLACVDIQNNDCTSYKYNSNERINFEAQQYFSLLRKRLRKWLY